jgi:glycosyltransferase involved in cell wall biosynthesis
MSATMAKGEAAAAAIAGERLPALAALFAARPAAVDPVVRLAVMVPCFNEEQGIAGTVETIVRGLDATWSRGAGAPALDCEILLVDDGSSDGSAAAMESLGRRFPMVRVLRHEQNEGYGAALKTALRSTQAELVAMTDADGTYPDARLGELVRELGNADMVVGARAPDDPHYPTLRRIPKAVLGWWVSWLVGRRVPDINSGFRAFRRDAVVRFLPLLPDGFSFTTTVTIAALRSGLRVRYVPIATAPRRGRSKIRPIRDTLAFVQLILRTGLYFAPLRMLAPFVIALSLATVASVLYDALVLRNFTDKTLILFVFTTSSLLFALLADMLDKRTRW